MAAVPKLNPDYERRPYWHSTMPALPDRSGRALPDTVDAVVIGGGYTGIAALPGSSPSRARGRCSSRRNTLGWGHRPGTAGSPHPGFKWGPGRSSSATVQSSRAALYTESVEATELLERAGPRPGHRRRAALQRLPRAGLGGIARRGLPAAEAAALGEFGTPAHAVPEGPARGDEIGTDRVPRRAGDRCRRRGRTRRSGSSGSSASPSAAGAELHEGVRATSIRRQADGRFVVETERGAILARTSSSRRTGTRTASRRRSAVGSSRSAATSSRPSPCPRTSRASSSPTGRAYFDTKNFLSYWHVSADRRMLFGGRV